VESSVPRRNLSVDNDSLSVIVPRGDKVLVPMSAARIQTLRKHLVEMLGEAKALKKAPAPYVPEPTGFAARVARAACSLCRGWCCQNGGDDAFLDDQTMARVRRINRSWMYRRSSGFMSSACRCLLIKIRAYFTESEGVLWIGHSVPTSATATSAAVSEIM
jgi:hypothetical protein